jgi:hypothetical protein
VILTNDLVIMLLPALSSGIIFTPDPHFRMRIQNPDGKLFKKGKKYARFFQLKTSHLIVYY